MEKKGKMDASRLTEKQRIRREKLFIIIYSRNTVL